MQKFRATTHHHSPSSDEGFTLIEVLAGIIMATVFVLITSQAIAISAVYRIKALRETEALNAVQSDLEEIKFAALQNITQPNTSCDPGLGNTTLGYGNALITTIGGTGPLSTTNNTVQLVSKDFTLTRTIFVADSEPYHMIGISYSVVNPDGPNGDNEITSFYTEVIPDAAFDC